MKRITQWLFGLVLLAIAHGAIAEVFCVDTALGLQNALSYAASNSEDDQIQVVQGTYVGNFVYGSTEAKGLAIKGGYTAECESRVIDPNNSILDGNQSGSVLIISATDASMSLMIQGVTIKNGSSISGGGLSVRVGIYSAVMLESNAIVNNMAASGGGIYITAPESAVTFSNNVIQDNKAISSSYSSSNYSGGGVYVHAFNGTVVFVENVILFNKAISSSESYSYSYGGGIYALQSSIVTITNNIIEGNAAESTSYSSSSYGGGIFAKYVSTIVGTNNQIQNNISTSSASYSYGGGIYTEFSGELILANNILKANSVSSYNSDSAGGGVCVQNSNDKITFTHNTITGNTASVPANSYSGSSYGGGVYLRTLYSAVKFSNNIIEGNIVSTSASNSRVTAHGGGVFASVLTADFINNSIHGNMASSSYTSYGGGLYLVIGASEINAQASFFNNIFWANMADVSEDLSIFNDEDADKVPSPVTYLANNFAYGRPNGYFISSPVVIDETNLSDIDPLFVNELEGDLRLIAESPMIDAGYPSTPDLPELDIEGNPRVVGESVDIGAYESDGSNPRGILSVTKDGTGSGNIISDPMGVNCGRDCVHGFLLDTEVMLTGAPDTDSVFDGWSGHNDCEDGVLIMDTNKQCNATFSAARQLTVNKAGEGKGTLTSMPAGIDCGSSCSAWFYLDEMVQLTPTADNASQFSGWTGAADCADGQITMTNHLNCTATFDPIYHSLLVLLPGTGTGTVTSEPSGINCGSDCRENYPAGTTVILTATAAQGSVFNGWAGACSGTSATCLVQINELTGITANFTALVPGTSNTLYVTATGGGNVTSSPAGITCGAQCDADFDSAMVVTLTPTPNIGLTFNGWCGACSGTSTCQVPMANDQAVMAAFGNTYPSEMLVLQHDQLAGTGHYAAPRLVILGPGLTVAAGSNLTVEAGERIQFLPGFKVENGARFQARINQTFKP